MTPNGARANPRLYSVWVDMRRRCDITSDRDYKNYGGRGITYCDEWKSFSNFLKWALENGYDKTAPYGKCTLDRIDTNGNYEPSNCRWVDLKTQCNNKRGNVYVEVNGETHTIGEWSTITGISIPTLHRRYKHGWLGEKFISPTDTCRSNSGHKYILERCYKTRIYYFAHVGGKGKNFNELSEAIAWRDKQLALLEGNK